MSLDIDWTLLSSDGGALRDSLLSTLNRALSNAKRPDFLGPISITHLELGGEGPQLDIVAIHDVWDEFRGVDVEGGGEAGESIVQGVHHQGYPKRPPMQLPMPSQPRLHTYRQYSDENPQRVGVGAETATAASSVHPGMGMRAGSSFGSSVWGGAGTPWGAGAAAGMGTGGVGLPTPSFAGGPAGYFSHWQPSHHSHPSASSPPPPPVDTARTFDPAAEPSSSGSAIPNLQLHASLVWATTSLRLSLSTSLIINHPSPGFMSLPLSVTATGLMLQSEVVLALEGDRKRVHISLVPLDEGALGDMEATSGTGPLSRPSPTSAPSAPQTLGARLLPSMTFESSVGQADKQTLRNVGKVERFILELIRKGVEDELVFPSFYTIDLNR